MQSMNGPVASGGIASQDWSLMLDSTAGGGVGSGLGQVVQGLDDVAQCIKIILTTPKGSDPLRPTFGADIWRYVDMPISGVRAQIVREAIEAITLWEPRIEVVGITVDLARDETTQRDAHLVVNVAWRIRLSNTRTGTTSIQTTVVAVST